MKKLVLILLLVCSMTAVYADSVEAPIVYDNDESLNVNVPDETKENIETNKPKLKNRGFIWQNSISPVNGVMYQSGRIIEPTPYNYKK